MFSAERRHFRLMLTLLAIIMLVAVNSEICHGSQAAGCDATLIKATYGAADNLEKHLVSELNRVMPILSTGFVNLENPKGSSAFGRLLGEQVASRFSQHGYRVIDGAMPKQRSFAKENAGNPSLPQHTKGSTPLHELQAAIVGDYMVSDDLAYVSVRLVKLPDNAILTSCDFSIRLNEPLKEMANRITVSQDPLVQKPIKTTLADPTEVESSKKYSKQETLDTKTDKKSEEKPVEKLQNGPFATGAIRLNPSNRLAAKIIQARLAELGFYGDKIDGIWKRHSREALKEFKEAQGLRYANRWDMNTQKALFQETGQ